MSMRKKMPLILITARYVLPLITGITCTVSALFYSVTIMQTGAELHISAARLLFNTLSAVRRYLGGAHDTQKSWYYGLLAAGAIVAIIAFMLALFFSVLAALAALRAFRAEEGSETEKRAKMVFKIAFPNRIWLFLSNCLWLLPALYAQYYALISRRFLLIGAEDPVYIIFDLPLLLTAILTVLTLALALNVSRTERRWRYNMFSIN